MRDDHLIEFWRCPACNKPYRAQRSMFELVRPYLPSRSRGRPNVVFLCERCNDLRSHSSIDPPKPRIVDIEDPGQFVWVQRVFRAQIACVELDCESPIEILALRTRMGTEKRSGPGLRALAVTPQCRVRFKAFRAFSASVEKNVGVATFPR